MKYKEIIQKMSLEEKAELCVGADYWSSKSFEKYEIPKIRMSDGPHGLRVQKQRQTIWELMKVKYPLVFLQVLL